MRLPKWVWKTIRSKRVRIGAVCLPPALMLLGAGYYGYENTTGRRAAEQCLEALEAQGFETDMAEFLDRGVTDEDNILEHPLMIAEIRGSRLRGLDSSSFSFPEASRRRVTSATGPFLSRRRPRFVPAFARPTPVDEWFDPPWPGGEAEAARLLLDDIQPLRELARGLDAALERPHFQWPTGGCDEIGIETPELVFEVLWFQYPMSLGVDLALLHLVAGDVRAAGHHVLTTLAIVQKMLDQPPGLVGFLVGTSRLGRVYDVVHEGVIRRAWSEDQLVAFETVLRAVDLNLELAVRQALAGEVSFLATGLSLRLEGRTSRPEIDWLNGWDADFEALGKKVVEIWEGVRPVGTGWKDSAIALRWMAEELERNEAFDRARLDRLESHVAILQGDGSEDAAVFTTAYFTSNACRGMIRTRTTLALLRTGIALERYRLKYEAYPSDLEDLVPEFLDRNFDDPWSKEGGLKYERMSNGGIRGWSKGENKMDDAGLPGRYWAHGDHVWLTKPIPGFTEADQRALPVPSR